MTGITICITNITFSIYNIRLKEWIIITYSAINNSNADIACVRNRIYQHFQIFPCVFTCWKQSSCQLPLTHKTPL